MDLNSTLPVRSQEDHWVPLSDLMAGLMMIFMLVAILFMVQLKARENTVKDLGQRYSDLRAQLCQDLRSEFNNDLADWKADLSCNLTVRFLDPNVQFLIGQTEIQPRFREILTSFFPRYVKILSSEKYGAVIEEVRIEGHTSSAWKGLQPEQAYYANMRLSQDRSRAVAEYVFSIPAVRTTEYLRWLVPLVTANGLSSSKPILDETNREDAFRSQRVEFRVRTKAEDRLEEILKALAQ